MAPYLYSATLCTAVLNTRRAEAGLEPFKLNGGNLKPEQAEISYDRHSNPVAFHTRTSMRPAASLELSRTHSRLQSWTHLDHTRTMGQNEAYNLNSVKKTSRDSSLSPMTGIGTLWPCWADDVEPSAAASRESNHRERNRR